MALWLQVRVYAQRVITSHLYGKSWASRTWHTSKAWVRPRTTVPKVLLHPFLDGCEQVFPMISAPQQAEPTAAHGAQPRGMEPLQRSHRIGLIHQARRSTFGM